MLELLLLAGVAGLGLALLAAALYRFPLLGVVAVLGVLLWEAAAVSFSGGNLGPLTAYPQDAVFAALAAAGAARLLPSGLLVRGGFTLLQLGWLLFGALVFLSVARGVAEYGPHLAGVELRGYFYLFSAVLYFMTFPVDGHHLRRAITLWMAAAGALVLLAGFRWALLGAGLASGAEWAELALGSGITNLRVLDAAQALFLAQAFVIGLYLRLLKGSSGTWWYLTVALLPAVAVLQHRTAWLALIVAVAVLLVREGKLRGRLLSTMAGVGVAGALAVALLFGGSEGEVARSLETSTSSAFETQESTVGWRLESWQVLLTGGYLSSATEYVLGKPFGAGYERFMSVGEVDISPHNFYVETFLRTGGIGLAALLFFYAVSVLRLRESRVFGRGEDVYPCLMYVLLLTQLVFFVSYAPSYEQGVLLGIAASLVTAPLRRRETGRVRTGELSRRYA
ncbi:MAG: O-antigen ligase family protein [Rubrobacter sp.]|nr:O-antigen ligase family protein [Rubrobacter sp.]